MKGSQTYETLLRAPEWRARRQEILKRDEHECLGCGSRENLQVHHRQYHVDDEGAFVKPWEYAGRYLVTLCDNCHALGHQLFKIKTFVKS